MNNLELWNKVKKTDPSYTKTVNQRGGYTSISPQYQIKCATEQFGSYGKGWGFQSLDMDYSQAELLGMVLVDAVFFYLIDGDRYTFPIKNSWPIKFGNRIDPDFAKKAETSTMSKALSKLGFSADIFMGEFDDPDYVENVGNEFALEKAEDKIEEKAKQDAEYEKWIDNTIKTLSTAASQHELKVVFTSAVRKANLRKDQPTVVKLTRIKDERKSELEPKND